VSDDNVTIVGWPPTPLTIEHETDPNAPPKVSIGFDPSPVDVQMNMDMNVSNKEPFQVCIRLCEPICVKSEYTIGIDVFDRPVAVIAVRGKTTFYNCPEEQ
jgi:hypothetical protein